jgi:hypothetical protein
VFGYHTRLKYWKQIRPTQHKKSGRWRINLSGPTGTRHPVYLNVLVWMHEHRRLPDGNVDHRDGNRLNDAPHNLRTHSRRESERQGFDAQQDKALRNCFAFFGYCAFWGDVPTDNEGVPDWYADWEPGSFGSTTRVRR